jgi:SAM-dependent methyltransferase
VRANVITTEIVRYPSTDVVAVSEQLPFRDAAFDGVLSLHVLEHVRNPFVCAAELMRILKPGGKFLVVTPYIVQVHGFPYHFFNPTADGLRALFADFATDCEISVPPIAHPVIALRELIAAFAPHLEPEALAALHEMTVGELSESDPRTLLESVLVRRFKPSGLQRLAANFALTGVRTSTGRPTPGAPC